MFRKAFSHGGAIVGDDAITTTQNRRPLDGPATNVTLLLGNRVFLNLTQTCFLVPRLFLILGWILLSERSRSQGHKKVVNFGRQH